MGQVTFWAKGTKTAQAVNEHCVALSYMDAFAFILGTCHDEVNNFRCDCPAGFLGKTCTNATNECSTTPCKNGGTCRDLHLDYNVSWTYRGGAHKAYIHWFDYLCGIFGFIFGVWTPLPPLPPYPPPPSPPPHKCLLLTGFL